MDLDSSSSSYLKNVPNSVLKKKRLYNRSSSLFSTNPNDFETPEERSARMELVRQLQKSFYQPTDSSSATTLNDNESADLPNLPDAQQNQFWDPINPNILHNLPLWRVQWSELPGYQNILNVHVPHYTHMFRTIFSQSSGPPWYFGHLFLEKGSENLNNPEYRLDDIDPITGECSTSKACLVGTLMQVIDYKENEEDGRLMLVVQGLERFKVISPSLVPVIPRNNCNDLDLNEEECDIFEIGMMENEGQNNWKHPYATATVELIPDQELIERQYYDKIGDLPGISFQSQSKWTDAHILAIAEGFHWHKFELRSVNTEECEKGGGISPLTNFDSVKAEILDSTALDTIQNKLETFKQKSKLIETYPDGYLFQNRISHKPSDSCNLDIKNSALPAMEYQVWMALDRMIRLLIQANPYQNVNVPIPAQMLNLLPTSPPTNRDEITKWPGFFQLQHYTDLLSMNENSMVGTATKSPFVQVDSMKLVNYPDLRRARLFSFVVWFLLDTILATDDTEEELTRQDVLEMGSIYERLEAAKQKLDAINGTLKFVLAQNKK